MTEFLNALKDYQHFLLILLAVGIYFKWQEKRKEMKQDIEADREQHKKLIEDTIKASLSNGISQKMREIIADHEKVEQMGLERMINKHVAEFHDRRRKDRAESR